MEDKEKTNSSLKIEVAVLKEKILSAENSLKLQAKEYERRLESLNHEASQLKNMQSTYLPRETWDVAYRELTSKIDSLQKLVYIGVGIALSLQIIFEFIK